MRAIRVRRDMDGPPKDLDLARADAGSNASTAAGDAGCQSCDSSARTAVSPVAESQPNLAAVNREERLSELLRHRHVPETLAVPLPAHATTGPGAAKEM